MTSAVAAVFVGGFELFGTVAVADIISIQARIAFSSK